MGGTLAGAREGPLGGADGHTVLGETLLCWEDASPLALRRPFASSLAQPPPPLSLRLLTGSLHERARPPTVRFSSLKVFRGYQPPRVRTLLPAAHRRSASSPPHVWLSLHHRRRQAHAPSRHALLSVPARAPSVVLTGGGVSLDRLCSATDVVRPPSHTRLISTLVPCTPSNDADGLPRLRTRDSRRGCLTQGLTGSPRPRSLARWNKGTTVKGRVLRGAERVPARCERSCLQGPACLDAVRLRGCGGVPSSL